MRGRTVKFVFGCVLLAVVVVAGCGPVRQKPPQAKPDSSTTDLAAIVTAFTPKCWKIHDKVMYFVPENLYEHIDGRAEFYLAYDMIRMCFVSFEKSSDSGIFIDISIYDMGTPTNAFGVFSTERPLGSSQLKLGRDAYRSGTDYYIWKGRYYVQIIAGDDSAELQQISMDIAKELTGSLEDSNEAVWGLTALPKANLVPQSVCYYLADAMALDFMKNTYTARYHRGQTEVTVFLSRQDSVQAAEATVAGFIKHTGLYGKEVNLLTVDSIELVSCDMGEINDIVFQKGCLVAGVTGVEDQDVGVQAAVYLWKQLQSK